MSDISVDSRRLQPWETSLAPYCICTMLGALGQGMMTLDRSWKICLFFRASLEDPLCGQAGPRVPSPWAQRWRQNPVPTGQHFPCTEITASILQRIVSCTLFHALASDLAALGIQAGVVTSELCSCLLCECSISTKSEVAKATSAGWVPWGLLGFSDTLVRPMSVGFLESSWGFVSWLVGDYGKQILMVDGSISLMEFILVAAQSWHQIINLSKFHRQE